MEQAIHLTGGVTVRILTLRVALPSWTGAREQERGVWTRLSVFSYGVFTCDLHFDECREALQESALS